MVTAAGITIIPQISSVFTLHDHGRAGVAHRLLRHRCDHRPTHILMTIVHAISMVTAPVAGNAAEHVAFEPFGLAKHSVTVETLKPGAINLTRLAEMSLGLLLCAQLDSLVASKLRWYQAQDLYPEQICYNALGLFLVGGIDGIVPAPITESPSPPSVGLSVLVHLGILSIKPGSGKPICRGNQLIEQAYSNGPHTVLAKP